MKIYSKEISDREIDSLLKEILSGKYKNIGDGIARKELIKQLTNNPSKIDLLNKKKTREEVIKGVKKALYKGIGVFAKGKDEKTHISTKNRIPIYDKLFSITGLPKTIVDLGCGVHALMYETFGCKPKYIGYEINEEHVKISNEFFKKKKINGEVFCKDVLQMEEFPKADVYFLFQFLDSLEQGKGHKKSEKLLDAIDTKWMIVSFSTITLSGKPMNVPERRWFNRLLERKGWKFERVDTESEVYYVILK